VPRKRAVSRDGDHRRMRTRGRRVRSTKVVGIGRQRADYLARRLATALKERRRAEHLSQRKLAELVGVSQPEIHRLEAGRGANAGLATWAAIAAALGMQLAAFIEQVPGASQPHDMEHLKRQDLVIRTANAGGWRAQPEAMLVDDGRYARSIDVLLTRSARREAAVVEVWDLITDGGAAMRGLEAKVRSTRERVGPGWRVQGLLVVRGTQRNRGLVASVRAVFATRFPASSVAWLRALRDPTIGMPDADGFAWTDVAGTRLIDARPRE
jgi:transcriptional regulator with XRE-family HTH domain